MRAPDTQLPSRARTVLSGHPTALEAARAASGFVNSDVEIVVFEEGRSFVVASTRGPVLQPRHQLPSECRLLESGDGAVVADGSTAVALQIAGTVVGALTALDADASSHADGLHALTRIVATALTDGLASTNDISIHEAVVDSLRDAVVVLDQEMNISWANRAVSSLFGRTQVEIIGCSAVELLHPDDVESAFSAINRLSAGLEIYRVFVRIKRGNGEYERVEVTGVDQSANPLLDGIVMSLRGADVAEELEASIDRATRMSEAIVAGLHDGIVATDQFGKVTMVNSIARDMFGLDPLAPAATLALADFEMLDNHGRLIGRDATTPLGGLLETRSTEVCLLSAKPSLAHVVTERRPVRDGSGELLGSVISFHDVTDVRRAADELRVQALHDQLTGLANRRQLDNRIVALTAEADHRTVGACFIDLDGFKLVNDTHGHRIGDEIICLAAERLQADVGEVDLLVRHGGDEFVALLIDIDGPPEALAVAERFRRTLSQPYTVGEQRFDLTASIGVALSSNDALAEDTLLRDADIALYAAKALGRNRVELFGEELASVVKLEERQRRMLRDVLENDRLVMHFQPLVSSTSGKTCGYEALARFDDEYGEVVSPGVFGDAITNSAVMWDLDRAAFRISCQAAAVLAKVTPAKPPTIACNFSAISLVQAELVTFITETVAANGIEPSQISIEITESSAFEAGASVLTALKSLSEAGFLLALDDFGTGYSSLAHLRDLPLSSVKVDRSFVAKLTQRSPERSIAEAIVNLASDMGLVVVAEGVESPEQLDHAQKLGFDVIQGWVYSPALSLTGVLDEWLNDNFHEQS